MNRTVSTPARRSRVQALSLAVWLCPVAVALAGDPPAPARDAARPSPDPADPLAALAWLAGCWEGRDGGQVVEEQWMAPRGGTMIGMSRSVAGGKTVFHESLRIESREGALACVARLAGQQEAAFTLVSSDRTRFVFENPGHDYPQRIIYRRLPDGSLLARIEGTREGKAQGSDYPFRRAPAPREVRSQPTRCGSTGPAGRRRR